MYIYIIYIIYILYILYIYIYIYIYIYMHIYKRKTKKNYKFAVTLSFILNQFSNCFTISQNILLHFYRSITFSWFKWFNSSDIETMKHLLIQSQRKFIVHFMFPIINLFLCWDLGNNSVQIFNKPIPSNRVITIFFSETQATILWTILIRHCFCFYMPFQTKFSVAIL